MENANIKNNKKKKIVSTGIALVSSAVLLTTATFAWFRLTNTPTANGLTMKAGAVGSLLIANPKADTSGPDTYGNTISFSFSGLEAGETVCLRPLTTTDGKTFYPPVYNDEGVVSSVSSTAISTADGSSYVNKSEKNGGYIIKKDFYLKASSTDTSRQSDVSIKLLAGGSDGTHIWDTAGKDSDKAVRASLTYGSTTVVLEPNYDKSAANQYAGEVSKGALSVSKVIKQSGDTGNQFLLANGSKGNKSDVLFDIPINTDCKVTLMVWIEGSDADCTEHISENDIAAQLKFICDDLN